MEHWINSLLGLGDLPIWGLLLIIAIALAILAKGADMLVEEAVTLSVRWGIPKMLIGATIVSLGTTLPEMAVSVVAAMGGRSEMALGNAVGSIICDTGLILGLATLLGRIPLDKNLVNRQGWLQLGAGVLLVLASFPWSHPGKVFSEGGVLPQFAGWIFLLLLVLYIWKSISWAKSGDAPDLEEEVAPQEKSATWLVFAKLLAGIILVIAASKILIPTVEETAFRLEVPQGIIAATLVAFGTSLPELVTAVASVRKGHGELALGNIIGADILNVLFVAGMAASVTPGGLVADESFFRVLFPAMLAILIIFRLSVLFSKDVLGKASGILLLAAYVAVTWASYSL